MKFDFLPTDQIYMANPAYRYFKNRYPGASFNINDQISNAIPWRPTFKINHGPELFCVEIATEPLPETLKAKYFDISQYGASALSIVIVCPESCQATLKGREAIYDLKDRGIGLVIIKDNGDVIPQHDQIPVRLHITEEEITDLSSGLPPRIRGKITDAFKTYQTNPKSGVQLLRQLIENMTNGLVKQLDAKGYLVRSLAKMQSLTLSNQLKDIVTLPNFKHQTAELGGVQDFIKSMANSASHAQNSPKKHLTVLKKLPVSFKHGIGVIEGYVKAIRAVGCKVKLGDS